MSASSDRRVLVVGAGGLGCAAADALVRAGVRALTVADDDRVDATNLHRQLLYKSSDVGELKVTALARALTARGADVVALPARVTGDDAEPLARAHAVVIDATDGPDTKFVLNDACLAAGTPLVHGGALGWAGQVAVIPPGGPCLRCLFDTPEAPETTAATCEAAGVMGPLPVLLGALQALETLKLLQAAGPVRASGGRLLSYDARTNRFRTIRFARRCRACKEVEVTDAA